MGWNKSVEDPRTTHLSRSSWTSLAAAFFDPKRKFGLDRLYEAFDPNRTILIVWIHEMSIETPNSYLVLNCRQKT